MTTEDMADSRENMEGMPSVWSSEMAHETMAGGREYMMVDMEEGIVNAFTTILTATRQVIVKVAQSGKTRG